MSGGAAFKCDVCGKMEAASTYGTGTGGNFLRPDGTPVTREPLEPIGWFVIVYQSHLSFVPKRHACGEVCAQMLITNSVLEVEE
jgi:hypothetical protein